MCYTAHIETKVHMETKAPKPAPIDLFPYRTEDLEPRDLPAEIAAEDAFIERNRDAINDALAEGYKDVEKGRTLTLDEVRAELERRQQARARK
jgi:predicted transcriptional regulator